VRPPIRPVLDDVVVVRDFDVVEIDGAELGIFEIRKSV
jgi:hypothetical protein